MEKLKLSKEERLQNRITRVTLLLDSLDEAYIEPSGDQSTIHGAGDDTWVRCTDCHWNRRPCPSCRGTGWRHKQGKEQGIDLYVSEWDVKMGKGSGEKEPTRMMTAPERDRDIERLERMAAIRAGTVHATDKEWYERADALERHGSYKELRRVLDTVYTIRPEWMRLVRKRDASILRLIARSMRGRIRVPKWL